MFSSKRCIPSTLWYILSLSAHGGHCDGVSRCPFRNEGLVPLDASHDANAHPPLSVPWMHCPDWKESPCARSCPLPVTSEHEAMKAWSSCPHLANSEGTSSCRVNWGLPWDCITLHLLLSSCSASFCAVPWVLIPRIPPNKLSTCWSSQSVLPREPSLCLRLKTVIDTGSNGEMACGRNIMITLFALGLKKIF